MQPSNATLARLPHRTGLTKVLLRDSLRLKHLPGPLQLPPELTHPARRQPKLPGRGSSRLALGQQLGDLPLLTRHFHAPAGRMGGMFDLLGWLIAALTILFLFRRQIKRAGRMWADGGAKADRGSLDDIIARERRSQSNREEGPARPGE